MALIIIFVIAELLFIFLFFTPFIGRTFNFKKWDKKKPLRVAAAFLHFITSRVMQ